MKKRIVLSGALMALVFAALGGWVVGTHASAPPEDSAYENMQVFTRVLQLIRQDYVDEKKVDYRDLTYSAMRGMLSSLDPHSQFMEPSDFKSMEDDTNSQFGGLGMNISVKEGYLIIVAPMEG